MKQIRAGKKQENVGMKCGNERGNKTGKAGKDQIQNSHHKQDGDTDSWLGFVEYIFCLCYSQTYPFKSQDQEIKEAPFSLSLQHGHTGFFSNLPKE